MAQLRQEHDKFAALDTVVVAIGPEERDPFAAYFEEHDLPFVGIPDPEHRVQRQYGQEIKIFKGGRMPAQAIIDKNGRVRYAHYGKGMADIPSNEELLEILSRLQEGQ